MNFLYNKSNDASVRRGVYAKGSCLTKEEESLLLDILFQQNYASEILAVELTDIENGLKQTDVMQYKKSQGYFTD